jgi:hypothetical protein
VLVQDIEKADMAKFPKGFSHIGLLINQHPGVARLLFIEPSGLEIFD